MKIWILLTEDEFGTNTEAFSDEALADVTATKWITERWDAEEMGPQPESWPLAMDKLYNRVGSLDYVQIFEHDLPVHPALVLADEMCRVALPKFNWGASALDAEAVDLLNRGQIAIRKAVHG